MKLLSSPVGYSYVFVFCMDLLCILFVISSWLSTGRMPFKTVDINKLPVSLWYVDHDQYSRAG